MNINHYLFLSALLFSIGLFGALSKKNAVAVLLCIELMLNAININLVAFTKYLQPGDITGQVFAIFVIVVAAAEIALALAIVIAVYRRRETITIENLDWLKW
ncbi:MAG: NADH-quinone oxidoreductase subunit NuoK [Peptococcaceae bacterium]|nr:NADH-quinone oxidoreductase subunit NuoK [Peptococcaceae bacterium]